MKMMNLIERIQYDLTQLMKEEIKINKENAKLIVPIRVNEIYEEKMALRTVISKLPLIGKKKSEVKDDELIPLIKSIIKDEKTRMLYQFKYITPDMVENISPKDLNKLVKEKLNEFDTELYSIRTLLLESYLPKETSDEDIKKFIEDHIDFSKLKSPMQAIGIIKNHFGNTVDGGKVKKIIDDMKG